MTGDPLPGGDTDRAALRAALDAYEHARAEIARLEGERDFGSGERTGRMANLAAWETERARLEQRMLALAGDAARGLDGRVDLEAVRALLEQG